MFHSPSDVPAFSPENSTTQIPQTPLQALLVSSDDALIPVIAVLRQAPFKSEVIPYGIDAEAVDCKEGIHDVACRFCHFLVTERPMCVGDESLWWRKREGEEDGWPVYCVKSGSC